MEGPRPKNCAACGRGIAAAEVYYRFTLVLQGEQDVLDSAPGGSSEEELASLVRKLEANPQEAREWEEQIHWEHKGMVCAACRTVVVRTLSSSQAPAGPH
jgi:2,3-bisphosphoglycerate-independent phosphoglycerate mutase